MEQLEKALARESQRRAPEKPPIINSVNDIIRIIAELDPNKNRQSKQLTVQTTMNVDNRSYQLSAPSKSKSKRDYLIEGLDIIKNRSSLCNELALPTMVNDIEVKPISLGNNNNLHWVDKLIKQWLNGYRDNYNICWDLQDGHKYVYNVWDHTLSKAKRS